MNAIKKSLFVADYFVFGIPTTYFNSKQALHGDERYLSLDKWRLLIKQADAQLIEQCDFDFRNWWQKVFNPKTYYKPKPYHAFVVKRKN